MRALLRFVVVLGLVAGLGQAVTVNAEHLLVGAKSPGTSQIDTVGGAGSRALELADTPTPSSTPTPAASGTSPNSESARASASLPLAGVRIALDPGHQLGNATHPRQIARLVPAGGFSKPCNSVGTSTNAGLPESTAVFSIATMVRARLQKLGATVVMTRAADRRDRWGPCIDARARFFARQGANVALSIHADGAGARQSGFHVITPKSRRPWTTDIATPSLRLAKQVRAGLDAANIRRSTYIGSGTALSIRSDLGTLNLSDVPVAMVELGNMRNAGEARKFATVSGRSAYAAALVSGLRRYLGK